MIISEKQLLQSYRILGDEDKSTLLKFATFLAHNSAATDKIQFAQLEEPKQIEARENESVVGALKRLSESYSMLEKSTLLDEAANLMSQHVMQGRAKKDVILELEQLFQTRYEKIKKESETQ